MDAFLQKTIAVIEAALKRRNITASQASKLAVNNIGMIRNMRHGSNPGLDNLKSLCDVLGLELYIGEPRGHQMDKTAPLLGTFKSGKIKASDDFLSTKEFSTKPQVTASLGSASPIAFKIGDNSFAPLLAEGDLIFMELTDLGKPKQWESFIGKLCLVQVNGTLRLCVLRRGDAAGTWNLESITSSRPDISQHITLCLPVKLVYKS